jgi:hypothetical protein
VFYSNKYCTLKRFPYFTQSRYSNIIGVQFNAVTWDLDVNIEVPAMNPCHWVYAIELAGQKIA